MSGSKQVSTMTWLWPLFLSMLIPSLLNMNGYAQTNYASVDLMITGGGILLSGILLLFVALPRYDVDTVDDPDRSVAWYRALAWPYTALGALIAGQGCGSSRRATRWSLDQYRVGLFLRSHDYRSRGHPVARNTRLLGAT